MFAGLPFLPGITYVNAKWKGVFQLEFIAFEPSGKLKNRLIQLILVGCIIDYLLLLSRLPSFLAEFASILVTLNNGLAGSRRKFWLGFKRNWRNGFSSCLLGSEMVVITLSLLYLRMKTFG